MNWTTNNSFSGGLGLNIPTENPIAAALGSYGASMPQTMVQSPNAYSLMGLQSPVMGGIGLQAPNTGIFSNSLPGATGLGTQAQAAAPFFSMDSFLGKNGQAGWGGLALGALSGIGSAFMGMKQYGLAKDALNQSKNQFAKNYEAQKTTVNAQLEDRQRARVAATEGRAESVDSYMERNRIK